MRIETLWARQAIKCSSVNPGIGGKGTGLTLDEVLSILGQVQHEQPVGSLVLDAKISLDGKSRLKLVHTLQDWLQFDKGHGNALSAVLAEAAVSEVCDTGTCPKCNGIGQVLNKKLSSWVECRKCHGVGRLVLNSNQLYRLVNGSLPYQLKMTGQQFTQRYYDTYMDTVDKLHQSATDAAQCARKILDLIAEEAA